VKPRFILYSLIIISLIRLPVLCRGEISPEEPSQVEGSHGSETKIEPSQKSEGRTGIVALGLRSIYFQMQQNRGELFRNITLLDENKNILPYKPVVQVSLSQYWAIELGYDRFRAATLNRAFDIYPEHDKRWTDGHVEWAPIMLTMQFRWPHFHKSIVPYVSGGISYTKTDWDRNDWYYYGFPSLATYINWTNQGNRPEDYPNAGYRRIFATDDHCIGALLGVGVDYFFNKNWALNLDWRYHWAKVNFTYTLAYDDGKDVVDRDHGTFILDSWILGLGIKYFF
jgi:hypothetical protein